MSLELGLELGDILEGSLDEEGELLPGTERGMMSYAQLERARQVLTTIASKERRGRR